MHACRSTLEDPTLTIAGLLAGGIKLAYHFLRKYPRQLRERYNIYRTDAQVRGRLLGGWLINMAFIVPAWFLAFNALHPLFRSPGPGLLLLLGLAAAVIALVPVGYLSHAYVVNTLYSPDVPSMADLTEAPARVDPKLARSVERLKRELGDAEPVLRRAVQEAFDRLQESLASNPPDTEPALQAFDQSLREAGEAYPRGSKAGLLISDVRRQVFEEHWIEVDEDGNDVGFMNRWEARLPPYKVRRTTGVIAVAPDGRVLFTQRAFPEWSAPGLWDVPGEHDRFGEGPEASALRLAEEELGFPVPIERLRRVRFPTARGPRDVLRVRLEEGRLKEDKAFYILPLTSEEVESFQKRNVELKEFWERLFTEFAEETGIDRAEVEKRAVADTRFRDSLRAFLSRRVGEENLDDYEVHQFGLVGWGEASDRYRKDPAPYTAGYYALVDFVRNAATSEFVSALEAALDEVKPGASRMGSEPTALAPYTGRWHSSLDPAAGPQGRAHADFAWFRSAMEEAAEELKKMPPEELDPSRIRERLGQALDAAGLASIGLLRAIRRVRRPEGLEFLAETLAAAARDAGSYDALAAAAFRRSQSLVPEVRRLTLERALSRLGWAIHPKTFLIITREEAGREPSAVLPARPPRREIRPRPARPQAASSHRPSKWEMLTAVVEGVAGLVRPGHKDADGAPQMTETLKDMISKGRQKSAADYLAYWRHGGADLRGPFLDILPSKMAAVLQRMDLGVMAQVLSAAARDVKGHDMDLFENLAEAVSYLDQDTQYGLMAALLWRNQPLAEGILHGGIWGRKFFLLEDLYEALQSRGEIANMVPLEEYKARYQGDEETVSVEGGAALELSSGLRERLEELGAENPTDRLSERRVLAGLRERMRELQRGYVASVEGMGLDEEFRKMVELVTLSRPLAVLVKEGVIPENPKSLEWSQLSRQQPPPATRWEWLGDVLSEAPAQVAAQVLAHFLHSADPEGPRLRQGGVMLGRFSKEELRDLIRVLCLAEPFHGARWAVAQGLLKGMEDEEKDKGRDQGLMRKYQDIFDANALSDNPLPLHDPDSFQLTGALLESDLQTGLDRVVARCVTEIYESEDNDRKARAVILLVRALKDGDNWRPFQGARRFMKGRARKAFAPDIKWFFRNLELEARSVLNVNSSLFPKIYFSVLQRGSPPFFEASSEEEGLIALGEAVTPENYEAMLKGVRSSLSLHWNKTALNEALANLRKVRGADWVRFHQEGIFSLAAAAQRDNGGKAPDMLSILAEADEAWLNDRWDALMKMGEELGGQIRSIIRFLLLKPVRPLITSGNLVEAARRLAPTLKEWGDPPDLTGMDLALESLGSDLSVDNLVKIAPFLPGMRDVNLLVQAYGAPFVLEHLKDFRALIQPGKTTIAALAGLPEALGKEWARVNGGELLKSLLERQRRIHLSPPAALMACRPFLSEKSEPWELDALWNIVELMNSWPKEVIGMLPEGWWKKDPEELRKAVASWQITVPQSADYQPMIYTMDHGVIQEEVGSPEHLEPALDAGKVTAFIDALYQLQAGVWVNRGHDKISESSLTRAGLRLGLEAYDLADEVKRELPEPWEHLGMRLGDAPPEEALHAILGYLGAKGRDSDRFLRAGRLLVYMPAAHLRWMIAHVSGAAAPSPVGRLLEKALWEGMKWEAKGGRERRLEYLYKFVLDGFEAMGMEISQREVRLPSLNTAEAFLWTGRLFYTDHADLPDAEEKRMIESAFSNVTHHDPLFRGRAVEALEILQSVGFEKVVKHFGALPLALGDILRGRQLWERTVGRKPVTEDRFRVFLRSLEDDLFDGLPPESAAFRRLVINSFHRRDRGEGGPKDSRAGLDILSKHHLTPTNYAGYLRDLQDLERAVPAEKREAYYENLRGFISNFKSSDVLARVWPPLRELAVLSGPLFPEVLGCLRAQDLSPEEMFPAEVLFAAGRRYYDLAFLSRHPEEFLVHAVPLFHGSVWNSSQHWHRLESMAMQWDQLPMTLMGPGKPISRARLVEIIKAGQVHLTDEGEIELGSPGSDASDLLLVVALPFLIPWLARGLLTAFGIHFDPQALGFLPSLAAVLVAVVMDELGHMAEAGRWPRFGMGGILKGPRIYVPGASGWSGLAARLGILALFLAVGHVTAPVAATAILAALLVSATDIVDVVRQLKARLQVRVPAPPATPLPPVKAVPDDKTPPALEDDDEKPTDAWKAEKTFAEGRRKIREYLVRLGARLEDPLPARTPAVHPDPKPRLSAEQVRDYKARQQRLFKKAEVLAHRLDRPVGIHVMRSGDLPLLSEARDGFYGHSIILDPRTFREARRSRRDMENFLITAMDKLGGALVYGLTYWEDKGDRRPSLPVSLLTVPREHYRRQYQHETAFQTGEVHLVSGSPEDFEKHLIGLVHWKFEEIDGVPFALLSQRLLERYFDKMIEALPPKGGGGAKTPTPVEWSADDPPEPEELGDAVRGLLDETSTDLGMRARQYAPEALGAFFLSGVDERVRAGDQPFLKAMAAALRRHGVGDLRSLRRFLAEALTGTHVYLEDAEDLAARPKYWKDLASELEARFFLRQYAFIVPDAGAQELLVSYGFDPAAIQVSGAFGRAEGTDRRRDVAVQVFEDAPIHGVPLGSHPSVTIHATPRMLPNPAGVESAVLRAAAEKKNIRWIDFLSDLPLSRAQLELIDRVAAAILAAA